MSTKVLIADDDAQLVRALSVTLAARGYEVATARDGRAAIDAVITERPDIVMLDLGMPRLDGIGVLEGIRAWSQVPVLVLSGGRTRPTRSTHSTPGRTTT